jgi:hypothetical protein
VTRTRWEGELCKRCDRRNCVGFDVSAETWAAVSRGRWNVLCTTCFDEEAELTGIPYSFAATWPVSWSDWNKEAAPSPSAASRATTVSGRVAGAGRLLRAALVALLAGARFGRAFVVVRCRPKRAVRAEVPGIAALFASVLHLLSLVEGAAEPPARLFATYQAPGARRLVISLGQREQSGGELYVAASLQQIPQNTRNSGAPAVASVGVEPALTLTSEHSTLGGGQPGASTGDRSEGLSGDYRAAAGSSPEVTSGTRRAA